MRQACIVFLLGYIYFNLIFYRHYIISDFNLNQSIIQQRAIYLTKKNNYTYLLHNIILYCSLSIDLVLAGTLSEGRNNIWKN